MFADQRVPKVEARQQLGLPDDVPVLLFFGMVREYKGLRDLLDAMPEIHAKLGEVILLVAGEFWEDKCSYLETIQRLGIGHSVIVEDRYIPNEEVGLYFSAADALVAPYRRATGSGVVQMARGFALPVITTLVARPEQARAAEKTALAADGSMLASEVVRFVAGSRGRQPARGDDGREVSSWDKLVSILEGRST
jgi:glycosyltransferase involved in cell wall biosynthesis